MLKFEREMQQMIKVKEALEKEVVKESQLKHDI